MTMGISSPPLDTHSPLAMRCPHCPGDICYLPFAITHHVPCALSPLGQSSVMFHVYIMRVASTAFCLRSALILLLIACWQLLASY